MESVEDNDEVGLRRAKKKWPNAVVDFVQDGESYFNPDSPETFGERMHGVNDNLKHKGRKR